jgi:ferric-dicitrate binding protein FerR (iron transport regulator)
MIMKGCRWFGALMLLVSFVTASGHASEPFVASRAMGTLIVAPTSTVTINGAPVISGTTVFGGDALKTEQASTAVLRLRSGASLAMSENSEVVLSTSEAGANRVDLRRGAIYLRNPASQADWVSVPGASVLVEGGPGFPAICRIAMVGQSSAIMNDRGRVEVRGAGEPLILPMGQYLTLEAGRPQGGSQLAGAVTAEIPKDNVRRNGQTAFITLKLNDSVYFNDLVKTEGVGRVRIQLGDGSLLNIGARSVMRIVKHDPQSQQTAIELTAGKLRSQVQKITRQGGSFEVKTQTAVIGVVGTHFLVAADRQRTRVWCLEGTVSVRNLNPAIVGVTLLHAGEFTTISLGMAPAAATAVSPSAAHAQISQTDATAQVGVGSAAATVTHVATIGASAGAATAAGVAIGRADRATNQLNQVATTLSGVSNTLNNAANNTNSALNNANNANQGAGISNGLLNGILQNLASPTYPCGCH